MAPCREKPLPALPTHLTSHPRRGHPQLQQHSTLSLPVLAAFPFNKFPVSKKIHKTQFLEVNNSETSEKETKTETSSVPNGHKEHAVAGACLLHVAPPAPHGAQWHTGLSLKTTIILRNRVTPCPGSVVGAEARPQLQGDGISWPRSLSLWARSCVSPALLC